MSDPIEVKDGNLDGRFDTTYRFTQHDDGSVDVLVGERTLSYGCDTDMALTINALLHEVVSTRSECAELLVLSALGEQ